MYIKKKNYLKLNTKFLKVKNSISNFNGRILNIMYCLKLIVKSILLHLISHAVKKLERNMEMVSVKTSGCIYEE